MSESAMIFLHALTELHPGSGTALGIVDLPVQRERHTDWPTIPGSSIKGILRDATRRLDNGAESERWRSAFGPEDIGGGREAFAGALSMTDARILAFPVRSLCGVFAWVTCPAVLARLERDLALTGVGVPGPRVGPIAPGQAALSSGSPLLVDGRSMVLEEYDFKAIDSLGKDAEAIAAWFAEHTIADEATGAQIRRSLAVLSDDYFTHFVRYATVVNARIKLDHETKTVQAGALFYQEFLPPETIFYSLVFSERSRNPGQEQKAEASAMMAYLQSALDRLKVLQVGGNETTGKGLCAVRLWRGGRVDA